MAPGLPVPGATGWYGSGMRPPGRGEPRCVSTDRCPLAFGPPAAEDSRSRAVAACTGSFCALVLDNGDRLTWTLHGMRIHRKAGWGTGPDQGFFFGGGEGNRTLNVSLGIA